MFTKSNIKLQQTRDLLVEVIAEMDLVIEEVNALRRAMQPKERVDGDPDYVQRIVRQREVLMNAAAQLADVRFEWRADPLEQCSRL